MIYKILTVIMVAAAPLSELRGAIPLGIDIFKLNRGLVVAISILGNLLPALAIAFFFEPLIDLFSKRIPVFHKFLLKHLETARHKTKKAVDRYGLFGLIIFIAVPLPLFGVYTGAAGAVLLGMPRRRIMLASVVGVAIAALIVFTIDAALGKLF